MRQGDSVSPKLFPVILVGIFGIGITISAIPECRVITKW